MKTSIATAISAGALCWNAAAAAYMIDDLNPDTRYHGATDSRNYGDVIGATNLFEVQGANLSLSGTVLTVDIYTNLAGRADGFHFSNYTNRPASTYEHNGVPTSMGIGYGDIFLATSWNPAGTGPNYAQDNAANGTNWSYGFSIDGNRWTDAGGTGTLYALTGSNDASALLTQDFMSGAIYRTGQEVAVDRASADATVVTDGNGQAVTGTWSVTPDNPGGGIDGFLRYQFDIGDTALWDPNAPGGMALAVHWAMSCGNDTLEGEVTFPQPDIITRVPEPGALALTLLGLAGLRRRMR